MDLHVVRDDSSWVTKENWDIFDLEVRPQYGIDVAYKSEVCSLKVDCLFFGWNNTKIKSISTGRQSAKAGNGIELGTIKRKSKATQETPKLNSHIQTNLLQGKRKGILDIKQKGNKQQRSISEQKNTQNRRQNRTQVTQPSRMPSYKKRTWNKSNHPKKRRKGCSRYHNAMPKTPNSP